MYRSPMNAPPAPNIIPPAKSIKIPAITIKPTLMKPRTEKNLTQPWVLANGAMTAMGTGCGFSDSMFMKVFFL